jgi:S-adenosylmethionine uptake transporter
MTRPQNPLAGALLGLGAFGLYAAYDISVKFLGGGYSAFQIIFFAGLMALPLVMIFAVIDPDQGSLRPVQPGLLAFRVVIVVFNGIIGPYAFANLPLAQCYAIFFTMPIFIALLAVPILGEKIDLVRGIAVVTGLVGVFIALDPSAEPLQIAHLAAIAGAMSGALNYVLLRKTGGTERTLVLMLYPMLAQLLVLSAIVPFVYVPMSLPDLAITAFMGAVLVAGSVMIIAAYRRARAIIVAPMQYSQIIWGTLMGLVLFNERLTWTTAIGTALIILAGVVIVARQERPQ